MNRSGMVTIGIAGAIGVGMLTTTPAIAQSCVPLRVVDGQGTQVSKKVSPPGTVVTASNWNTDFVVPSGQRFRRFVARVLPANGGEYRLLMALKYNDDTSDTTYDQTQDLAEKRPFNFQGAARTNATPYQVNVSVGGIEAVGNSYTLSAQACY